MSFTTTPPSARVPDDAAFAPGTVLSAGYDVLEHLHRSRDYDVYDVWSAERRCRCIAKTPCPDALHLKKVCRRLEREAHRLLKLTHPHLARAYTLARRPEPVLILETLGGETLSHLVETSKKPLSVRDLAILGVQLASVIGYLHHHQILHLDLKPSNIVVEAQRVKLLDLSIARAPGKGKKGRGTRQYLSVEQARGDPFSAATDIWGIGAVLFEAATQEAPFAALDDDHYEQLERRADYLGERRRFPKAFAALIDRCLEPDPAERPSLEALYDGLLHFTG